MDNKSSSTEFKVFIIGTLLVLATGVFLIWSGAPATNLRETSTLEHIPIWEMPWFMNLMKIVLTCVVLQVYFLAIARPALQAILYGKAENAQ